MTKGLENRVQQVSKQVDNASIRRTYPSLGQQEYVTLEGSRWKDIAEKGPSERWVNIAIHPLAFGELSQQQVENLMTDLKRSNLTPILGAFGIGGPYSSGFGPLGDTNNKTTVFYFKKDSEQLATEVCAIVMRDLPIKDLKPTFVDAASFARDDKRRFVIEHSGLDAQVYVFSLQK